MPSSNEKTNHLDQNSSHYPKERKFSINNVENIPEWLEKHSQEFTEFFESQNNELTDHIIKQLEEAGKTGIMPMFLSVFLGYAIKRNQTHTFEESMNRTCYMFASTKIFA